MSDNDLIEAKTIELGQHLLNKMRINELKYQQQEGWVEKLFSHLVDNERFRVQALRFVDVLPALDNAADLARHMQEYFTPEELNYPGLSKWWSRLSAGSMTPRLIAPTIRKAMRLLGQRFLAGETVDDLYKTIKTYQAKNLESSLDLLGEAVVSEKQADKYLAEYINLIESLATKPGFLNSQSKSDAISKSDVSQINISVKPSSLYSQITHLDTAQSISGIAVRLRSLFRVAMHHNAFVMLDMEQYELKDIVLGVFKRILIEHEFQHWSDVGIAIQAYLKEAEVDVQQLIDWTKQRGTPVTVRLVKGAYWDAELIIAKQNGWDIPVFINKQQTESSYEKCLDLLLSQHPVIKTAVATHNVRSIAKACVLASHYQIEQSDIEFQMLNGMAEVLRQTILDQNYWVRVYFPYGKLLPGMSYLVRRLLENTSSQSFLRMSQATTLTDDDLLENPNNFIPQKVVQESSKEFVNEPLRRFVNADEKVSQQKMIDDVRQQFGQAYLLLIDGKWIESSETIISVNPANHQEVIGKVALAEPEHIDAAVNAARNAFKNWSKTNVDKRVASLLSVANLLRENKQYFTAWLILESGKSWQESDADVAEAIDFLEYYAKNAKKIFKVNQIELPGELNYYRMQPRGVGVILSPWNFPLAIMVGMLSAAIVTGNTVVLKPSPLTPVLTVKFVELLIEAGIPAGVVNLIQGGGKKVGELVVNHADIAFIAFTGSLDVGVRIREMSAKPLQFQKNHKHIVAEMGGKNAIIIDSDADLDDAVPGVIHSAFSYQGQKCSACSRVVVVGGHYDNVVERIVDAAKSLCIGSPEQPINFVGPIISSKQKEKILSIIEEGKTSATLVLEVKCEQSDGDFIGPVIFKDVAEDSVLNQKEIFGPVLVISKVNSFDEAIQLVNKHVFALTGGVYSRSPKHLQQAVDEFDVGNLYLNRKITGAFVNRQPFGGLGLSGTGYKAGGPNYLLQFVQEKTITENTMRRGFAPSIE